MEGEKCLLESGNEGGPHIWGWGNVMMKLLLLIFFCGNYVAGGFPTEDTWNLTLKREGGGMIVEPMKFFRIRSEYNPSLL